jgi:hypothetical protein
MTSRCATRGKRDGYFVWCERCRKVYGVSYNDPDYDENYEQNVPPCRQCKAPAKLWDAVQVCWKCGKEVPYRWQIHFD